MSITVKSQSEFDKIPHDTNADRQNAEKVANVDFNAVRFKETYKAFIKRDGSVELLKWLEESTDFFSAPCSTKYHLNHKGGLVEHSLNVFKAFQKECENHSIDIRSTYECIDNENIAIIALLHDICKANFYKVSYRNVKNEKTGYWEKIPYYTVDDQFAYGHGEKSVYFIQKFMKLTDEEAQAIRWHMGGFDEAVKGGSCALSTAYQNNPLALLIHIADMKATYLYEK